MQEDGQKILDRTIAAYLEERKKFVRGFVRFVISQGHGALVPSSEGTDSDGRPLPRKTWQQRGREIYGRELFNQVMREELAVRRQSGGS